MGWTLHLTSYDCSQAFKQPLGRRLVCRGHSSALLLKQNLHPVQLEMEGGKGWCKEGAWLCTPVVNLPSKDWETGFSTSASPPSLRPLGWSCAYFKEPKRLQNKQHILWYSGWGSSGQVLKSELQIPGEPGRGFPELDAFRVRRTLYRIFQRFGLQCL